MSVSEFVVHEVNGKFGVTDMIQLQDSFIENGILRSMQLIELLFDVEEQFDIEFDFNSLDITDVESPYKIEKYVKEMQ